MFEVRRVQRLGLLTQDPDDHFNAVFAEDSDASPMHAGIWIFGGHHDARNASINDRFRAWTSASPVATRLQGHVHGRPLRERAGVAQRENLCMRLTRAGVKSSTDHLALANHDRAHKWIWAGPTERGTGQVKGFGHVLNLRCYLVCGHGKKERPKEPFGRVITGRTDQPSNVTGPSVSDLLSSGLYRRLRLLTGSTVAPYWRAGSRAPALGCYRRSGISGSTASPCPEGRICN